MADRGLGDDRARPRYAAALRYADGMAAPIVVAKGRGLIADEIVRQGNEHGIAIHVSDNLAAMLMQVELDRAIPPQLFHAVAQLLAWLYLLEARAAPVAGTSLPASLASTPPSSLASTP